jgi:hypothetical protein
MLNLKAFLTRIRKRQIRSLDQAKSALIDEASDLLQDLRSRYHQDDYDPLQFMRAEKQVNNTSKKILKRLDKKIKIMPPCTIVSGDLYRDFMPIRR